MADANETAETQADESQETETQEQDYKALYEQLKTESRKWEGRSKANEKELNRLKAQANQDRTVEDRLAALEAENEALKVSTTRSTLVDSVAKATGLDRAIVAAPHQRRREPSRGPRAPTLILRTRRKGNGWLIRHRNARFRGAPT